MLFASWPRGASRASVGFLLTLLAPCGAGAGNEANYVLYSHHMEEAGETEINLFADVSQAGGAEANYAAQLLEIEHGVTGTWTAALISKA